MITLEHNALVIPFPEVHRDARVRVAFQRTLRIPDDGRDYPLPPGLGVFPLHHVEDYAERLPATWQKRGGVFLPLYQSEALWLHFGGNGYPIALQIAAGKINAVSGEPWQDEPQFEPQGYVVAPDQPWLDGFCVEHGRIRQFVAAPLGQGISVEEQLTGKAEFGGLQIKACPLKAKLWERLQHQQPMFEGLVYEAADATFSAPQSAAMGLGMGGSMKQEIYADSFAPDNWETAVTARCFVHLINSIAYAEVTGHLPPHRPYEAADYTKAGLPWFDYYSDQAALQGSDRLKGLKTWRDFEQESAEQQLHIHPKSVIPLGERPREGRPVSQGESA